MKALSHLNKYLLKYKWRLLLGIVFIIASNYFGVLMPQIVGQTFDEIDAQFSGTSTIEFNFSESVLKSALYVAGIYIVLSILKGFFLFLTRQTIIIVSRYIEYDLKNEIYAHYQRLPLSFYKKNSTGDLMNRVSEDVSKVRMYLGPGIMYTVNLVVLSTMVISFMISTNPILTLYALISLPVMSLLVYYVSHTINKNSEKVQRQQSYLSTLVQETISGIRVVKAYNKDTAYQKNFAEESIAYKNKYMKLAKIEALFMPTILLLIGLSTILTIYKGGLQAIDGEITAGQIAAFVIYVNMLTWPFASVGWVTSLIQRASASQERINEFLQVVPEIENENQKEEDYRGKISFKNVNYTYKNSGIEALKNISFEVNPGETLAIIGRTGSGKSTIAHLILRQLEADSGEIFIDDQDIKSINLDRWRTSIGYVPQEVFLFSETIANNISFGVKDREVPLEEVIAAAKKAEVHENIEQFPQKYKTYLGERGINLSGGQKQRVSIARAIIKNPEVLIFDDCLSAVDTDTEEKILNHLKGLMGSKTSVVISHRVSSVKNADKILVMDQGMIIEQGTHDSLMEQRGTYHELYEHQMSEG